MLKLVQHDKLSELVRAEWLPGDKIRSLQDDKDKGCVMAGSLTAATISTDSYRDLPTVGMTNKEVKWWQGH